MPVPTIFLGNSCVCPIQDRPAVYRTGDGENRSRTNEILLNQAKARAKS